MNHPQRNATLVSLQASDERSVFSARPHVSNFLILHHESSCIWIFYVFCFPVASTNLSYDLFSSTLKKYETTTERKSATPLSSTVCSEKHHSWELSVDISIVSTLVKSFPYRHVVIMTEMLLCLFVFFLVFLCTASEKFHFQSLIKRNLYRSLINLRGLEGSGPQRCQSDAFNWSLNSDCSLGTVVERTRSNRLSGTNRKGTS